MGVTRRVFLQAAIAATAAGGIGAAETAQIGRAHV